MSHSLRQPFSQTDLEPFRYYECDVHLALKRVTRTSQGSDPLPYWFFKLCAFEITPIVTKIFNLILAESTCPTSWKHSIVTPIPKVSTPRDLGDLRPISVTPILSRVFDRLFVRKFFLCNIPKNDLADQFAFKPTGSTTAALSYIFSNITETLQSADHV